MQMNADVMEIFIFCVTQKQLQTLTVKHETQFGTIKEPGHPMSKVKQFNTAETTLAT